MEITIPTTGLATGQRFRESPLAILLSRHGHKILALLPLLILIWVVARYAVDVPYLDQWDFVPLLDKMYQGELSFHDLWVQFNEHRYFFPKVILLGLARLTGWNIRWECGVCILLAIGVYGVLMSQLRLTARALGLGRLRWATPACSLIVFSISQFENWLWGWQVGLLLGLVTGLGAILLLANQPFRWGRLIGALVLGFVATFSFANGVLVWPIGLGLLCVLRSGRRVRALAICVWILAAALSFWLYLRDYQHAGGQSFLSIIFTRPLVYAAYVLRFIGSTCAQYGEGGILRDKTWSLILGAGGLTVLGWAGWSARRRVGLLAMAPYLALCAYSLGTAFMAANVRATLGPGQPLCSRYCSLTVPLWLSIIVLLMIIQRVPRRANAAGGKQVPGGPDAADDARIARLLLWGVIAFLAFSSGFAIRSAKELSVNRANGRRAVLALKSDPAPGSNHDELFVLSPSPRTAATQIPILLKYHLSTFRE